MLNLYLVGIINEFLTVEESNSFVEHLDDELDFNDYTQIQRRNKIILEYQIPYNPNINNDQDIFYKNKSHS